MEIRLFNTRLRLHPATLLVMLCACRLGLAREVFYLVWALIVHESAHLVAARALHVSVSEMTLLPFGGAIAIGNPYALSPIQLGCTAAAGPLANLAMIPLGAAAAHWGILNPGQALNFMYINGLLMLFNLLPALPLDGGRIAYALMRPKIGSARALGLGLLAGKVLAAGLILLALILLITRGAFNLSYVFCAIFLISSGPRERQSLLSADVCTRIQALSPLCDPLPVCLTSVSNGCPAHRALRHSVPSAVNLFAVYEGETLIGFTDDRQILKLCLRESIESPVGQAVMMRI